MFNKKIASEIAIGVIFITAIIIGGIFYFQNKEEAPNNPEQKACTMEAKVCSDGSAVGRAGPNCEFAPCPGSNSQNSTGMANPASVYCEQNGGKSEIRTTPDGGQTGYCKFDDGSECEEWAYLRKECDKGSLNNEIDTLNWQTYTNTKYGYSFKYPKNWYIYGGGDIGPKVTDKNKLKTVDNFNIAPVGYEYSIYFGVAVWPQLNEEIDTERATEVGGDVSEYTTFLNMKAVQVTNYLSYNNIEEAYDRKRIVFNKNGDRFELYGITKDYVKDKGIDMGIFDVILATFKFIN